MLGNRHVQQSTSAQGQFLSEWHGIWLTRDRTMRMEGIRKPWPVATSQHTGTACSDPGFGFGTLACQMKMCRNESLQVITCCLHTCTVSRVQHTG